MTTRTLVLTPWYFPHKVICWQDAITLMYLGKVDVVVSYDEEVRSPSTTYQLPAVVRLQKKVGARKKGVRFSRRNVYTRDDFMCGYCNQKLPMKYLTYDHVLPRSRGGRTVWENIVTACYPCNAKKANRTPAECGMRLRQPPYRPLSLPFVPPQIDPDTSPVEWRDFVAALPRLSFA